MHMSEHRKQIVTFTNLGICLDFLRLNKLMHEEEREETPKDIVDSFLRPSC